MNRKRRDSSFINYFNLATNVFNKNYVTNCSENFVETSFNITRPLVMLQSLPFYLPAGAFALCIVIATYLPSDENDHSVQHSMALHAGLVISIPFGIDILLDLSALKSVKWDMLHVFSRIRLFVSLSLPYYAANENELISDCAELFRNVGACGAIFALTS